MLCYFIYYITLNTYSVLQELCFELFYSFTLVVEVIIIILIFNNNNNNNNNNDNNKNIK